MTDNIIYTGLYLLYACCWLFSAMHTVDTIHTDVKKRETLFAVMGMIVLIISITGSSLSVIAAILCWVH